MADFVLKRQRSNLSMVLLGCVFGLLVPVAKALASGRCGEEWVAKAVSVQGTVEAKAQDGEDWQPVTLNQLFCGGELIRVLLASRAALLLKQDATNLQLDQNSTLTLPPPATEATRWVELLEGAAHFLSRTPTSLKVKAPFLNAHIEGTEFMVHAGEKESSVLVFAGRVLAENTSGRVTLVDGQQAVAAANQAPRRYMLVQPRDAVAWALYYPPLIDWRAEQIDRDGSPLIGDALALYRKGKSTDALAKLKSVPEDLRNQRYLQTHAGLLLTLGRSDDALTIIDTALRNDPVDGISMALKAMVILARGDKEAALGLAKRATVAAPNSAVPWVALSYVQQARFDLEDALTKLDQALRVEPEDALVHARRAELLLSLGRLDEALESAKTAKRVAPELSRTHTVLGFVYLTQIRVEKAKNAFAEAIALDSSFPLSRLGLGLALIRDGDLDEGVKELEVAASLDPNNSQVRSYLGKGYFEQRRNKLAAEEYTTARTLDPNDPTPWFYGAIQEQTTNRPVEALKDLQHAIKLNGNRLIYRSSLQLDQDLAARSASLGRIYSDLGFDQLALAEAWRSMEADPANYSDHRFLADAYSALPRHEMARASELLQSQLLQPQNVTPVSPTLPIFSQRLINSDDNSALLTEGAGSARATFNEFNPLFSRNKTSLYGTGLIGTQGTARDEVVAYGIRDRISYSFGQSHFETNGFRENNDLKQDFYNAFVQANITPKLSIQGEYRYMDSDQGYLRRRFDPLNFPDSRRLNREVSIGRAGFNLSMNTSSYVLGSFIKRNINTIIDQELFGRNFGQTAMEDSNLYELQHILRSGNFFVYTGYSRYYADIDGTRPGSRGSNTLDKTRMLQEGVYAYTQSHYFNKSVHITAGVSADFFDSDRKTTRNSSLDREIIDRNHVNPKLGVLWNISENTLFRVAAFKSQKKHLPSNQTLEPTQIAGFNQFFDDDFPAVSAWRYGLGLDHKLSADAFMGAEVSAREIKVINSLGSFSVWREQLSRAYVNWIPHAWVALRLEFQHENMERNLLNVADSYTECETIRVPMGVSVIHPSGFFVSANPTYVAQSIEYRNSVIDVSSGSASGRSTFWVVGVGLGYRMVDRHGLITVRVENIFDERFNFQETDLARPLFAPSRQIYGSVSLYF